MTYSIGLPILTDDGELEYPGYIEGTLVGFYPTVGLADRCLASIVAVTADVPPGTPPGDDLPIELPEPEPPCIGDHPEGDVLTANICDMCGGEGRVPNYTCTGAFSGGYADVCSACDGRGVVTEPRTAPADTCHACRGAHATQRCHEVRALLFAPLDPSITAAFDRLARSRGAAVLEAIAATQLSLIIDAKQTGMAADVRAALAEA